jgi:hypothetical protein
MTFRIFQVSSDGIASPVYSNDQDAAPSVTASDSDSGAKARRIPFESHSEEWHELRERLRQQTTKPPRKTWLGL